MFQQFFTTTVVGSFIKALLQSTPLPKYKTVKSGDYIRSGFAYVYGIHLIKCTASGFIGGEGQYEVLKNDTDASRDGSGTFFLGDKYTGRTDHIHSLNPYYDEDTHEALGEYLRCYRDIKGIDLMPFYNCFSYRIATDFYIKPNGDVVLSYEDKYKVVLIPVKYYQEYSVFVDSTSPVIVKPVIYNNGLVYNNTSKEYLYNYISATNTAGAQTSFNQPFFVSVNLKENKEEHHDLVYSQERYLYLAIQLEKDNKSSICVLEGRYNHGDNATWTISEPFSGDASIVSNKQLSALSLTQMNDGRIYAFADRLVEYLLKNVIDKEDTIDENTVRVQKLANKYLGYEGRPNGVYSEELKSLIFNKYIREHDPKALDITGYTDKDIEGWLESYGR